MKIVSGVDGMQRPFLHKAEHIVLHIRKRLRAPILFLLLEIHAACIAHVILTDET